MTVVGGALVATAADAAVKAGAGAMTTALFKAALERAERSLRGPAKATATKALAALQGYGSYLEETNDRVSSFKTFADPTKPVSLLDHFVETKFESARGRANLNQDDLVARLRRPSRIVVSATAGYGKSMVMRYIALSLYANPMGRIPIFLELRNLNRVTNPSIISYIHSSYKNNSDIKIEAFRQGLSAGVFVLILDGFDELNHDLRAIIEDQIIELIRDYPLCSIIVSGRPDERFKSWKAFTIFKVAPMAQPQVVELINKLDYEKGVRGRFVKKVKGGLYESHQSFMSTPLLAILMLLTFEQNANIPDKMHLFYGEAFKTLFHKHDALKEQYDRARKSGLAVDDFEKVFSVFCLKTYVQERIEFSFNEINASIKDAIAFNGATVSTSDFLFDIEEAVCLVMKEGASFFFVHRSFQEYFTAVFLSNCAENIRDEFIEQVSTRYWDNVLPMLFDMASSQIEPTWVTRMCEDYLSNVSTSAALSPLEARFDAISFGRDDGKIEISTFNSGVHSRFLSVMRRFYPTINVPVNFSFSQLEAWAKSEWDKLILRHKSQDVFARDVEAVKVPIKEIPAAVLEGCGIIRFCNDEYNNIQRVYAGLDKKQKAKNDFLNKLFSSR